MPVQGFILGCTWPGVVSNYLNGAMSGDLEDVRKAQEMEREKAELDSLEQRLGEPEAEAADEATQREIEERLKALQGEEAGGEEE